MRIMSKDLVSVIIPVYNASFYLKECIESVLHQTYYNLEIVIIDDGSTDNSVDIVKSYQYDNRIKIITQKNRGAATARNVGIKNSRGKYIQFLDADDILSLNKIEEQLKTLESYKHVYNRVVVFSKWESLKKTIKGCKEYICHTYENPIDILADFMKYEAMLIPHCYLVPRHIIDIAGLWDESLSLNDDGEWFARIIASSDILVYCNDTMVYYRDTPNSLSKSKSVRAMNSEIWGYILISEIARRSNIPDVNYFIFKFLSAKLIFYYPYYKEYRMIGEMYLKSKMPDMNFSYPHLSIKIWMYYWGSRLGIIKEHLPF